jgi:hypothetical protein
VTRRDIRFFSTVNCFCSVIQSDDRFFPYSLLIVSFPIVFLVRVFKHMVGKEIWLHFVTCPGTSSVGVPRA